MPTVPSGIPNHDWVDPLEEVVIEQFILLECSLEWR